MSKIVFIENKSEFNVEANRLFEEFKGFLKIENLSELRVLNCYNFFDISDLEFKKICDEVLFDAKTDLIYYDLDEIQGYEFAFRAAHKVGQYNQREDMINEILKLQYDSRGFVRTSKLLLLNGIDVGQLEKIKAYYINLVDSQELALDDFTFEKPAKFEGEIAFVENFIHFDEEALLKLGENFSMDLEDMRFVQEYFKSEGRNPSVCELKLIDTYWSDHCRHTTFLTQIEDVEIEAGMYEDVFRTVLEEYEQSRQYVHGGSKPLCLMDLATINMKELTKRGILDNVEISDEVNACSIEIPVDVDGVDEEYLLMFKNETHNHPTEIEPYGGAHTCIGGGIRDPLSARSYVFQAMRITGAKDPRASFEQTMDGKLAQRKLCQMAMSGYSDYANQIACTGGFVREFYHGGFEAKRMELGALVSAVKKSDILRGNPVAGDVILLLGARTGRDGLGAAVGSSAVQTEKSLERAGAQVQKGNPYEERNIIRLFRNPKATKLIKRCNDFGAGGVSVAIGELAAGLEIDLSKVKLKYEGLNDWEIALSESQERMAVVVAKGDVDEFLRYVEAEDVDYSVVAQVSDENRVHMVLDGKTSVDIKREFLDTNGIRKKAKARLVSAENADYLLCNNMYEGLNHLERFRRILSDINGASQKNLISNFDNSVGRGTVLAQLGGKNALTPQEGMVAKIPLLKGNTNTCSIMSMGYDPILSEQNPFLGGYYAVLVSLAKQAALGADVNRVRLSFQEFYERLTEEAKWGKPLQSLLGAYKVLKEFELAAIGGKDSMSGSFNELNVPPSLLSFAVSYDRLENIVSKELKKIGSKLLFVELKRDDRGLVDLKAARSIYMDIKQAVDRKLILSMSSIENCIAQSMLEMSFGNDIGVEITADIPLYTRYLGSLLLEVEEENLDKLGIQYEILGNTQYGYVDVQGEHIDINELKALYTNVFDEVYAGLKSGLEQEDVFEYKAYAPTRQMHAGLKKEHPKVLIPIFKGNTGEYDLQLAFEAAGAVVDGQVFKFRSNAELEASIAEFARILNDYDVLALPSGAVLGNEAEQKGSMSKYILTHPKLKSALERFIADENKLILGIAEGFQALINTGLIEFGVLNDATDIRMLLNDQEKFVSAIANIQVISKHCAHVGEHELLEVYQAPIALKAGKIELGRETFDKLYANHQVITIFKSDNLTGSKYRIEGLSSPNGRIFGCISGIDRMAEGLFKNANIENLPGIINSTLNYFR